MSAAEAIVQPVAAPGQTANDSPQVDPPELTATPKQARELQRIRLLAKELLERASRLEEDLFTAEVKKRVLATTVPSAKAVAKMAKLRKKHGLANR